MTFTVKVRQFDRPIEVAPRQTILEAALEEDYDYPFICRGGTCGTCRTVLIAGKVELKPYAAFALSDEEREQGLILACRALPLSDCEVAFVDLDEPAEYRLRSLEGAIAAIDRVTHDTAILRIETTGAPLDFAAGQFARLALPGLPPRDYSFANRPGSATLEFHVRVSATGAVSRHVYDHAKVGDPVTVKGPYGASYLRKLHRGPIYLLAGGSGLAPIKSILDEALAAGLRQPIRLYFGVRAQRDLYLDDYLADLAARSPNLTVIQVLSEPGGPTGLRTGNLADALRADIADGAADGTKAYLCGPPVMVETCRAVLIDKGIRPEDCHADAFYTQAELDALTAG
ncbi:oxidoreductase [Oleomonas cavernae]|uniref:Oxidoreductase n=1 Tax=Oleomonas cavernae TaxID=2320859 RepID=A0A418WIA0_9PROT|nr:2Fe-2S iron-sulfur cluster-binding protein [Oleomonas cavernae]RJF89619.1 oxidoreductase [Oleomonas cavernae]